LSFQWAGFGLGLSPSARGVLITLLTAVPLIVLVAVLAALLLAGSR
jgi:hypothetical protein